MHRIDEILTKARAAAFEMGVPALSEATGVPQDSIRRLLKSPPTAVNNLRRIETFLADRKEIG